MPRRVLPNTVTIIIGAGLFLAAPAVAIPPDPLDRERAAETVPKHGTRPEIIQLPGTAEVPPDPFGREIQQYKQQGQDGPPAAAPASGAQGAPELGQPGEAPATRQPADVPKEITVPAGRQMPPHPLGR
jgi:hypothetical protein